MPNSVPPGPNQLMINQSQGINIVVEDSNPHAIDSVVSQLLFHDTGDQSSFDEWMQMGESTQ
jgi:hypothetical protein